MAAHGDIVRKGDVLFVIDQEPYEIKLAQAQAQLAAANARLDLATRQLTRAQTLKATDAGSAESYQNLPQELLGLALQDDNPLGVWREVDGEMGQH